MKIKTIVSFSFILLVGIVFLVFFNNSKSDQKPGNELYGENEENEEHEAAYQYLRWKYEADMIKDPTTGEALFGLRDQEIDFARTIPARTSSSSTSRSASPRSRSPPCCCARAARTSPTGTSTSPAQPRSREYRSPGRLDRSRRKGRQVRP